MNTFHLQVLIIVQLHILNNTTPIASELHKAQVVLSNIKSEPYIIFI